MKKQISDCSTTIDNLLSIETLQTEKNFLSYIKLLKQFATQYCIIVTSADTPWGPFFTNEMTQSFMDIGFRIDLYNKFRCGYAGIIDSGELIFEEILLERPVEASIMLNGHNVEVVSVGFNAPKANSAIIKIDGINHAAGGRGLSFVVYDKRKNMILDSVRFDTYSKNFVCNRPNTLYEGLKKYKTEHPNVTIIGFNRPAFPTKNLTQNERFILEHAVGRATILNNLDKPIFAINKYYNVDEIVEVLNAPKSYHDIHGIRRFEDMHGKRVNTLGGHRITVNQPVEARRTIFIVGGCHIFGVGAADEHTIASFLQDLLNETFPEDGICVQNYGFFLMELEDAQSNEELMILNSLPVKNGDIILWNFRSNSDMPFIDVSQVSNEARDFEIYSDTMHLTPHGYLLTAHKLFEGLLSLNILTEFKDTVICEKQKAYGFADEEVKELEDYKKSLKDFYDEMFSITIGSIVMNCNPFTLGHRYLVEQALLQCDYLAIFVVQEEKSVFPFEDRMRLVSEGVADLPNVMVIPSGRFIISSLTFSEYFNKAELQEREVDTSMDVLVFAKEIAPCLHITKRFAGEEPFDLVTKQYNESMRKILPEYGIEFIEIPRIKANGEVVSASRVRRLLEEKNFSVIKELVPESTFKYLLETETVRND